MITNEYHCPCPNCKFGDAIQKERERCIREVEAEQDDSEIPSDEL